ncbi:MAG TPA: hypothetical protein VK662_10465 [Acidothermaceae bacterium]|nr:hypothetical protein [Acidothermaceae bacterium]
MAAVFELPPLAPGFEPEPGFAASDLLFDPALSDFDVAAALPSLAGFALVPPDSVPEEPEDAAAAVEAPEPESDDVDADPPASTEDLDSLRLSVR